MNRAERRAKDTAWRVAQKLKPKPKGVRVSDFRLFHKQLLGSELGALIDEQFVKVVLHSEPTTAIIDEAERTSAQAPSTDQGGRSEAKGRT